MDKRGDISEGRIVKLCRSDALKSEAMTVFGAIGASFPTDDEEDELLIPVRFPLAWAVKPTNHYMYSDLLDSQGRKRGVIGYKGVFYDRWASFYFTHRYRVEREFSHLVAKEEMPPEIAKLQVLKTVQRLVEIPVKRRMAYFDYDLESWVEIPPERTWVEEQVETNLFEPYSTKEHRNLPYARYVVVDTATGERLFVSGWYSLVEYKAHNLGLDPGTRWLNEHFPQNHDLLAYW